ncbi:MAG: hypothetical protein ACK5B9_01310 [Flavobacteriia bacterium]
MKNFQRTEVGAVMLNEYEGIFNFKTVLYISKLLLPLYFQTKKSI